MFSFLNEWIFVGDWQGFWVFAAVASLTPGPNNTLLMTSGLRFGLRRTLPHYLGVISGFSLMFLAIGQVIKLLNPEVLTILRYFSIGLILYLSWKIATAPIALDTEKEVGKPWLFIQAAAFQWVNPKAWMMITASLAAYHITPLTGAILFSITNFGCLIWVVSGIMLHRLLMKRPAWTRGVYIMLGLAQASTLLL